jgi:hypothetical protein
MEAAIKAIERMSKFGNLADAARAAAERAIASIDETSRWITESNERIAAMEKGRTDVE